MFIIEEINNFLLGLSPFCAALVWSVGVVLIGIVIHIFCNIIEECGLSTTSFLSRIVLAVVFLTASVILFVDQFIEARGGSFALSFFVIIVLALFVICLVSDIKGKFKSHKE